MQICALGHMCRGRSGLNCLRGTERPRGREVFMKLGSDQNRLTLLAVTALVAHAPILVFPPAHRTWFPNGYERVDIKILEWIQQSTTG